MTIELTRQEAQYLKSVLEGSGTLLAELDTFKSWTDTYLDVETPRDLNHFLMAKVEHILDSNEE